MALSKLASSEARRMSYRLVTIDMAVFLVSLLILMLATNGIGPGKGVHHPKICLHVGSDIDMTIACQQFCLVSL